MFESFAFGYGRRKASSTMHDASLCNLCLEISLAQKNLDLAEKIVLFCKEQIAELPDNLSGELMSAYIEALVDADRRDQAYHGIMFMNELQITKGVVEAAIKAGQSFSFTSSQKQTLNSMFSSSSKWTMLK